jgi:hypothetical protein
VVISGRSLSLVNYIYSFETETHDFNFINIKMFYDFLNIEKIIFGPFVGINYLNLNDVNGFSLNKYNFSAGLYFGWMSRQNFFNIPLRIIGGEIGYKNNNRKSYLYISINIDLMVIINLLYYDKEEVKQIRDKNNEYERNNK